MCSALTHYMKFTLAELCAYCGVCICLIVFLLSGRHTVSPTTLCRPYMINENYWACTYVQNCVCKLLLCVCVCVCAVSVYYVVCVCVCACTHGYLCSMHACVCNLHEDSAVCLPFLRVNFYVFLSFNMMFVVCVREHHLRICVFVFLRGNCYFLNMLFL